VTLAQLLAALPALEVLDLRLVPSEDAAASAAGAGAGAGAGAAEEDSGGSDGGDGDDGGDGGDGGDGDGRVVFGGDDGMGDIFRGAPRRQQRARRRRYAAWPEGDEPEEPRELRPEAPSPLQQQRPLSRAPPPPPPPSPSLPLLRGCARSQRGPKRWSAASLAQLRLVGADVPPPRSRQQQGPRGQQQQQQQGLAGFAGAASLGSPAHARGGGGGRGGGGSGDPATAARPGGPAWRGRLLLPPFAGAAAPPSAVFPEEQRARVTGKRPAAGAAPARAPPRR
jgi:hypothetical protein